MLRSRSPDPAGTMAPVAQSRIPFRVFQRAVNQRLSCRKITCKAFPFVVEEQRVTSYFLLVKKKRGGERGRRRRRRGGKRVERSQTLWIYLLYFFFTCGWMLEGCAVPPQDFSLALCFFARVTWWKWSAEITKRRGSPLETRK